ncbi:hypothetical protein HNQ02_002932 [Flavobacterium sp. 7E]|uniref:hypothetical protein n=1 Tax=Flavobacterium sp. 7E TaxID=2735898 RepID=UPI00156D65FB|nr:hypothetical protein [Flavobacterium sp. 7E]NRS89997.1 hypothetical protein [Flavobacterium sp. 7E]
MLQKKCKIKIIIVLVFLGISFYGVSFMINLLLNKQYVVNEISNCLNKQGLDGAKEVINSDYIDAIYLIFVLIIIVWFLIIKEFASWRAQK